MTQIPGWLAVMLASVQVFGALAAMLLPVIAVGGALVAFGSYRQRRDADRKAEWWRRTQYSMDLMLEYEDVVKVNTGMQLISAILDDPTATREDSAMMGMVVNSTVALIAEVDLPPRAAPQSADPE